MSTKPRSTIDYRLSTIESERSERIVPLTARERKEKLAQKKLLRKHLEYLNNRLSTIDHRKRAKRANRSLNASVQEIIDQCTQKYEKHLEYLSHRLSTIDHRKRAKRANRSLNASVQEIIDQCTQKYEKLLENARCSPAEGERRWQRFLKECDERQFVVTSLNIGD